MVDQAKTTVITKVDREDEGAMTFLPDLAVEVLLPGDRPGTTLGKVADYLIYGTVGR